MIIRQKARNFQGLSESVFLPAGDQRSSQYQEFRAEADSLLDPRGLRSQTSYGGFLEVADPHYLGVAKDRAPFLNRFRGNL